MVLVHRSEQVNQVHAKVILQPEIVGAAIFAHEPIKAGVAANPVVNLGRGENDIVTATARGQMKLPPGAELSSSLNCEPITFSTLVNHIAERAQRYVLR